MRVDFIVGPCIRSLEGVTGDRVKIIVYGPAPDYQIRTVADGFLTAIGELVVPLESADRKPSEAI